MYKEIDVVMLATNKDSSIAKEIDGRLKFIGTYNSAYVNTEYHVCQHLYFLSNEEIKEGDWYIFNVGYASGIDNSVRDYKVDNCKKIIATTDTSLGLPQPPESFIQHFVAEYNKGNIITKVMVEYDKFADGFDLEDGTQFRIVLTINLDNTINIKLIDLHHGKSLDYWKQNAEEDYMTTPISVLKYITVLEEKIKDRYALHL